MINLQKTDLITYDLRTGDSFYVIKVNPYLLVQNIKTKKYFIWIGNYLKINNVYGEYDFSIYKDPPPQVIGPIIYTIIPISKQKLKELNKKFK